MRKIYVCWMCEFGHLHPMWVQNKCTQDDCTVALTFTSWLKSILGNIININNPNWRIK